MGSCTSALVGASQLCTSALVSAIQLCISAQVGATGHNSPLVGAGKYYCTSALVHWWSTRG